MDVLEAREAQLRRQLFGADSSSGLSLSPSSPSSSSSSSLSERAAALHTRLEQLYGAVTGFARLNELYDGARPELEMAPTSALGAATSRPGDEIKRAVILSSEARVDAMVRELRRLQELQPVLAELEQRRSHSSVDEQQLQTLERSAERESQRALALHARVERVLAVYHEMISFQRHIQVLSEKSVEYALLLDELSS